MKSSGGDGEIRFLDSGASRHFEPNRDNFTNIRTCEPYEVEVADGRTETACEIGDIRFQCRDMDGTVKTIKLTKVYYAPWMRLG